MARVLVLAYGNPAREDDGLGPLVAERVGAMGLEGVEVDCAYQPGPEDAAALASHDAVVFVDASVDGKEPYSWSRVEPARVEPFSTHALTAAGVAGMARDLLGFRVRAFQLGVRGYSFGMFRERTTRPGRRNALLAARFLGELLGRGLDGAERGMP